MRTIKHFLIIIFGISYFPNISHSQSINYNEYEIINALLDTIGYTNYCTSFRNKIPINSGKVNPDCSSYLNGSLFTYEELASFEQIVLIDDKLVDLKIGDEKHYVLSKLDSNSTFYKLIKNYRTKLNAIPIKTSYLHQGKINFYTKRVLEQKGYKFKYRLTGKQFYYGRMTLSRVFYDNNLNAGFFYFNYIGGGDCGYGSYIFFSKEKNKWVYKKIIKTTYY